MADRDSGKNTAIELAQPSRSLIVGNSSRLAFALSIAESKQQITPSDLHNCLTIYTTENLNRFFLTEGLLRGAGFISNITKSSATAAKDALSCMPSLVFLLVMEPLVKPRDLATIKKIRTSIFPCEIIVLAYGGYATNPEAVWKYIDAGADIVWGGDYRHLVVSLLDAYPRIRKIKQFLLQSGGLDEQTRSLDIDSNGLSLEMGLCGKSGAWLTREDLNQKIFFSFSELYDLAEFMYKHSSDGLDYQKLGEANVFLRLECWATSWGNPGYRSSFVTQQCACGCAIANRKIEAPFCKQCDRTLFKPSFFKDIPDYVIRVRLKRGEIGEYGEIGASLCMNKYIVDWQQNSELFHILDKSNGSMVFQISPNSLPTIISFINHDMVAYRSIAQTS